VGEVVIVNRYRNTIYNT